MFVALVLRRFTLQLVLNVSNYIARIHTVADLFVAGDTGSTYLLFSKQLTNYVSDN